MMGTTRSRAAPVPLGSAAPPRRAIRIACCTRRRGEPATTRRSRASARWLPVPRILADQSLKQAILIPLNNAADVSPDDVQMRGEWEGDVFRLAIVDRGSGMPADGDDMWGRVFFTTKPEGQGTGLGLVLADMLPAS